MAAFYTTKGWYKSKTIWTSIVGIVLAVAALFGVHTVTDAPTIVNTAFGALFALTALFRVNATEQVAVVPTTTV